MLPATKGHSQAGRLVGDQSLCYPDIKPQWCGPQEAVPGPARALESGEGGEGRFSEEVGLAVRPALGRFKGVAKQGLQQVALIQSCKNYGTVLWFRNFGIISHHRSPTRPLFFSRCRWVRKVSHFHKFCLLAFNINMICQALVNVWQSERGNFVRQ